MKAPLAVGGIGLLGAVIGWAVDPVRLHFAWLAAFTAWLAWPLGSMTLLLIQSLAGGKWGITLRPALVAGICTLPLALPAAIPLVLGLPATYPWVRDTVANAFYLNLPFFALRGVIDLVVWFAIGILVLRDRNLRSWAPACLVLMALTLSFAAIDLTMSLDPAYNSSIYGMIAATSACLMALCIATLLTALTVPLGVLADLSRILLGIVVLWAYLAFMQFLIVWESDLSHESQWYLLRSTGVWGVIAAVIAAGTFLLPFAVLLVPRVRRSRAGIAAVCAWLAAMEMLRTLWLVLPAAHAAPGVLDLACLAALFGLGTAGSLAARRRWMPAHV